MKRSFIPLLSAIVIAGGGVAAGASAFAQNMDGTRPSFSYAHPPFHMLWRMDDKAELLGVPSDELLAQVAEGKHLPDILAEAGLTEDELKARMQARQEERKRALTERIQGLVSSGRITQEQADAFLERTEQPHKMGRHGGPRWGHRGKPAPMLAPENN